MADDVKQLLGCVEAETRTPIPPWREQSRCRSCWLKRLLGRDIRGGIVPARCQVEEAGRLRGSRDSANMRLTELLVVWKKLPAVHRTLLGQKLLDCVQVETRSTARYRLPSYRRDETARAACKPRPWFCLLLSPLLGALKEVARLLWEAETATMVPSSCRRKLLGGVTAGRLRAVEDVEEEAARLRRSRDLGRAKQHANAEELWCRSARKKLLGGVEAEILPGASPPTCPRMMELLGCVEAEQLGCGPVLEKVKGRMLLGCVGAETSARDADERIRDIPVRARHDQR